MKAHAQMSLLDGVLSAGIPLMAALSWGLAYSVQSLSDSWTGFESAMILSVEILSILVMLWWLLGVILGIGYLLRVRSGAVRMRHRDENGTFLLPRYLRNTVLTLGGAALGLGAVLAPAQAADAYPSSAPSVSAPAQVSTVAPHTESPQGSPFYHGSPSQTGDSEEPVQDAPQASQETLTQPQSSSVRSENSGNYDYSPVEQTPEQHQSLSPFFGGQREGSSREVMPASRGSSPRSTHQVVVAGDSLWSIACQELGDDASPPELLEYALRIHAANIQVIGDNPNILYPGQTLTLPDHP